MSSEGGTCTFAHGLHVGCGVWEASRSGSLQIHGLRNWGMEVWSPHLGKARVEQVWRRPGHGSDLLALGCLLDTKWRGEPPTHGAGAQQRQD